MGFGWIVQVGLFDIAFRGSCIAGYTYTPTGYSLLLASPCGNSGISVGFLTKDLFLGLL